MDKARNCTCGDMKKRESIKQLCQNQNAKVIEEIKKKYEEKIKDLENQLEQKKKMKNIIGNLGIWNHK